MDILSLIFFTKLILLSTNTFACPATKRDKRKGPEMCPWGSYCHLQSIYDKQNQRYSPVDIPIPGPGQNKPSRSGNIPMPEPGQNQPPRLVPGLKPGSGQKQPPKSVPDQYYS